MAAKAVGLADAFEVMGSERFYPGVRRVRHHESAAINVSDTSDTSDTVRSGRRRVWGEAGGRTRAAGAAHRGRARDESSRAIPCKSGATSLYLRRCRHSDPTARLFRV